MKITVEFDLGKDDSVDTEQSFKEYIDGPKWKLVAEEFDNYLRDLIKYQNVEKVDTQDIRDKFLEMVADEDLKLWG